MISLSADGIRLCFDPSLGLIESFQVADGDREIAPLHRAPWLGTDEAMPADAAPHLAKLGGDFFCAPFGGTEGTSPLHGWPANSRWTVAERSDARMRAKLEKRVFGAVLHKEISLRPGHPFVYQRHVFVGGQGRLPVSNHANVSLPHGGLIRTSPKALWRTPDSAQETDPARGRSGLRYPAESVDASAFPGVAGNVDLTAYPWFPRHEDFVVGIEAPGHKLGWTAVTRPNEGDLFLSLRSAAALPMTMLWHSNGGRDYPPWSGRHFGCLGVEEGAAVVILGSEPNLRGPGAVTLDPLGKVTITHVIGAVSWPSGRPVQSIELDGDALLISAEGGGVASRVPFDPTALALPDR